MRRTAMIAAVLSVGMLTACQTQEAPSPPPTSQPALTTATPEPAPTTEAAPATEATPTTAEPVATTTEPEAVIDTSEEGAEAFVEDWVGKLNEAYKSGDTSELDALYTPNCKSCAGLIAAVPDSGLGYEYMRSVSTNGTLIGDLASITAEVEVLAGSGAGVGVLVFDLVPGNPWLVDSITLKEEPS